jgi:hypothetical protein
MSEASLSPALTDAALRLAGVWPEEWLCPVCGAVVPDEHLTPGSERPPLHEHHGRASALVPRAQL